MKKVIVATLMLGCVFSAYAQDECSNTVNGYVKGLEIGTTLAGIPHSDQERMTEEVEQIKDLQTKYTDCEVVDFIPPLKESREALKYANDVINKRG